MRADLRVRGDIERERERARAILRERSKPLPVPSDDSLDTAQIF